MVTLTTYGNMYVAFGNAKVDNNNNSNITSSNKNKQGISFKPYPMLEFSIFIPKVCVISIDQMRDPLHQNELNAKHSPTEV